MSNLPSILHFLLLVRGLVISECSRRTVFTHQPAARGIQTSDGLKHKPLLSPPHQAEEHLQPTNQVTLIRRPREISSPTDGSDFTWKATKTPLFITSKLKKQNAEPILTVSYPSGISGRSGRSRELILPVQQTAGKRIVYYATLPDVPRYSTYAPPSPHDQYSDFVPLPVAVSNQQRSYDPTKAGKDFVTRVQSSIIDIRPRGDAKDKVVKSTPTFTIIDAPPTHQYPGKSINRIMMYPDYPNKQMTAVELQSPYATPQHRPYHLNDFKTPYFNSYATYLNANIDKSQYQTPQQYPYSHQSSPYYEDLEKMQVPLINPGVTTSHSSAPPYPSRHTRFPTERYPLGSPFSDLVSSSNPTYTQPDSNFHHSAGNFNLNGPSTIPSNLDLNDNLVPSLDHSLDLDYHRFPSRPLSQRNKFSSNFNFENLGNKYLDLHGFHNDFPYKVPESPSYNSHFSQVSDWLTNNKPFDGGLSSSFDLDDFSAAAAAANAAATGDHDYHVKGTLELHNQNGTTSDGISNSVTEVNNTIITPFTTSFTNNDENNNNSEEARTAPPR